MQNEQQPDLDAVKRIFGVEAKPEPPAAQPDEPEELVVMVTTNRSPNFSLIRTRTANYAENPALVVALIVQAIYRQTGV